jgi:hypothetical protein
MAIIGTDCHIRLTHPAINAGQPFGFLLEGKDDRGPAVALQREVDAAGGIRVRLFFTVLLANDLVNPDGTPHDDDLMTMYTALVQYLAQISGLTVEGSIGVFSNVGAQGHSSTETHYTALSLVTCQLNNTGIYYPPADPVRYYNSSWDGPLTWETSYWR